MQDNDKEDYESSEDEHKELVVKIDGYFKESAGQKKGFEKDLRQYEKFHDGKQWEFSDGIRPVKNHIFKVIEGQLPILTSGQPSVDVIPTEEAGFDKAKMLSSALAWVFEKQSLQLKNGQMFRSLLKTGTAFLYVDFDPDLENGLGDVTIKELNWKHCFPDPNCSDIESALFFGIKLPMRASEVKRKFPLYADKIKAQTMSVNGETGKINQYTKEDRWDGYGGLDTNGGDFILDDMVMYEEMWHKDYETVPVDPQETLAEIAKEAQEFMQGKAPDITQYEDHDAHQEAHNEFLHVFLIETASKMLGVPPENVTDLDIQGIQQQPEVALIMNIVQDHIEAHDEYKKINPSGEKPKYDHNLRLTIKISDDILHDDSAPVEDGMIPVAVGYCYKSAESFWATGDIKNMIDSQKEHNELGWTELSSLLLNGNNPWVVDEEAQVDADTITNDPGLVIKKKKEGDISRMPPVVVSPQLAQKQLQNEAEMEQMAGLPEASQGRAPSGFTAARAVVALQQAGNGRANLKADNYKFYTLPRLARLCLSRIIKYWNTERLLRLYDDNGKIQFIKFDPKEIADFEYDIKVVQGSSLGYDKGQLMDYMSDLVKNGMIPAKVMFQAIDVPFRSKILEALEIEDQKNMEIQKLQQMVLQYQQLLQPADNGQGKK